MEKLNGCSHRFTLSNSLILICGRVEANFDIFGGVFVPSSSFQSRHHNVWYWEWKGRGQFLFRAGQGGGWVGPLVVPMWMVGRGSLPFAQQEGRCVPLLLVRGYSGPVQKMVQQLCQIVKVLVVLSYRVRAQLQEQCRVISLKYACVVIVTTSNSYN